MLRPSRAADRARPAPAPHASRPDRPRRPGHHLGAVAAVAVLAIGLISGAGGEPEPRAADAAVTPTSGFSGTVAGWTSWYGAYGLAELGWAWCIDHGSAAPDPDLVYGPTSIAHENDPATRAALAWAVTMNPAHDATTAAAIMLALHDLRDASYPFGVLDLDQLGPSNLAGFDGAEGAVLDRARAIKGDALAHAHLREPFTLAVAADRAAAGGAGAVRTTLTDAAGAPVAGVPVTLRAGGASLTTGERSYTADDGTAWFGFVAGAGANEFAAHADLPRSEPAVFAPTVAPAQRVIVPSWAAADGTDRYAPPAPTTTTTTAPTSTTTTTMPPPASTTTTTRPPTTTTTRPTTTTTRRPTTTTTLATTTTTRPATTTTWPAPGSTTTTTTPSSTSSSTTTTTLPAPARPSTTPPTTSAPRPPGMPTGAPTGPARYSATLPTTGRSSWSWALIGIGLVLCGASASAAATRRRRGTRSTGEHEPRPAG